MSGKEEEKRGFIGATLMPSADSIMCVTGDQRLLFFAVSKSSSGDFDLQISKRLIGYNDEVIDVKFIPGDKDLLAVATNLEQVSF
jgi:U3 small nucleolar RNA-associated protein 13